MATHIDLSQVVLVRGGAPEGAGYCVEQLVSALAGESWSDAPLCASPVIAAYCRVLNDMMPDSQRQRLIPYAPRQIGTRASRPTELRRAYVAADYAVRVFAPLALRALGSLDAARQLEQLSPIVDAATATAAAATATTAAYATTVAYAAADAAATGAVAAAAAAEAADAAAADAAATGAAEAAAASGAAVWDEALACLDAMLAITAEDHDALPAL